MQAMYSIPESLPTNPAELSSYPIRSQDVDETVTTAALKPHKHTTKTDKQQGEQSTPHKGLVGILERGA